VGEPPPAYAKPKPLSSLIEPDSDKYKHMPRPAVPCPVLLGLDPGPQVPSLAPPSAGGGTFLQGVQGRKDEIMPQSDGAQSLAPLRSSDLQCDGAQGLATRSVNLPSGAMDVASPRPVEPHIDGAQNLMSPSPAEMEREAAPRHWLLLVTKVPDLPEESVYDIDQVAAAINDTTEKGSFYLKMHATRLKVVTTDDAVREQAFTLMDLDLDSGKPLTDACVAVAEALYKRRLGTAYRIVALGDATCYETLICS